MPTVPVVVGRDEQAVLPEEDAPPPPPAFDVAAVPPALDAAVLLLEGDALGADDPPDDGVGVTPPDGFADPTVCVGTPSGSVPQDDDVVTPPVALGDTEHGIPCGLNAGLVCT